MHIRIETRVHHISYEYFYNRFVADILHGTLVKSI